MRVVLLGATGMVGGGVLIECLEDPSVEAVLSVGRRTLGRSDPKLEELVAADLFALSEHADRFEGYDACFYCLGTTSAGKSEDDYRRITRDLTVAIVDVLVAANPEMTVCFVSGQGSDSSESGRIMWARVKGEAENAVIERASKSYIFRPGFIQPLKGVRSGTALYQIPLTILAPVLPLMRKIMPRYITTTVIIGRAMIQAVESGYPKQILEGVDINELGEAAVE